MDEALSRLIPTQRIGNDGFTWWVGQVEGTASDEENNKGGYRYKVRIVGDHTSDKEVLPTENLPWCSVIMPVNVPFMPGNIGGGHPQLVKGCWVTGHYLDNDKQKPIIMGSIGPVPGSTVVINDIEPNNTKAFQTGVGTGNLAPVPATDGTEGKDGTAKTGGGLSDGTKRGDGELRVDLGKKKIENIKDEQWCQVVAEKCKDVDLKTQMKSVIGEMLYQIQNNNGNIGTYYVSKVTGKVNESVGDVRGYVDKAIRIVREFLGKIKGFITQKIKDAVDALVKAILRPGESGNVLTPVTEFFNNMLKDLGCQMADIGERLIEWLTNVLMSYINQLYRAAVCQIDELVNGIISKIQQLMNNLLDSVLGPLQDILGAIAAPFDMIGNAINYVLKLLGISCSGPDQTCAKYKKVCTDGSKEESEDDKGFLDGLLDSIDNLFGDTPADYTQYICDEAYTGRPLTGTTIGFIGGVPAPPTKVTKKPKIVYTVNDIVVQEGESAVFTVTRSGFLDIASSVRFKIIKDQGTATAGDDYIDQDTIVGFAPNETEKTVSVQTLQDSEKDSDETFFAKMTKNSPMDDILTEFVKDIGRCIIREREIKEPYDPYVPGPTNPFIPIDDPPTDTLPDPINVPVPPTTDTPPGDPEDPLPPTYQVVANRSTCPEGGFIIYTITTTNLPNGSILYYNLTGRGITPSDIIGNRLSGSFIINDNESKVTVGIEEDNKIEDVETLTFTITGQGASTDVLITVEQTIDDIDEGVGDSPETVFEEFEPPKSKPPITDDNGGIIEIPIDNPGDPWVEPPIVFVGGEGTGATATALLDANGFVTEIRIQSPGYGYKLNRASDNNIRCIIDAFTILRPGVGYETVPDMYVNGQLGIAEAVIDPDSGFVIGARILNREITFEKFPAIDIVGGGGYGAKLLPSLACLDTEALSTIGSTKIGTGKYIDCP